MTLSLFRRTNPTPARRPKATRQSFALESLEERVVMSHAAVAPHVMPAVHVAAAAKATVSVPVQITAVNLTGVTTNAQHKITGLVGTVTGTIAGTGHTFTTTLAITQGSTATATKGVKAAAAVPVLDLHLGPINLNLLGLQVKTSEICLNVTAQTGPGNLLGNLVGGLANALNGTLSAASATDLAGLNGLIGKITGTAGTATSATDALNSLNTLIKTPPAGAPSGSSVLGLLNSGLTSAFNQLTPSKAHAAVSASASNVTNLLHLSVGPLNLNLLGLVVRLDNCHNGPVTVDVNAISGAGNLLGNLLTSVAHLLDNSSQNPNLLAQLDNAIIGAIGQLHL